MGGVVYHYRDKGTQNKKNALSLAKELIKQNHAIGFGNVSNYCELVVDLLNSDHWPFLLVGLITSYFTHKIHVTWWNIVTRPKLILSKFHWV